jgi:hypothetical protein
VNAPELNEKGGIEAKEGLIKLVQGKKVYLDVDYKYVMDIARCPPAIQIISLPISLTILTMVEDIKSVHVAVIDTHM